MRDDLFDDLLESVDEAGAVRRGERPAERTAHYDGKVLVEVRERGEIVWSLDEAAAALREKQASSSGEPNPRAIREALRQTQEGFAELLGVSVRTLQGWEQGRRAPRGPSRRLLSVASAYPLEVLDATPPA